MYWFSGINNHNKKLYYDYIKMYKVAVITAKQTNPQLKPVLVVDGENDEYIDELKNMGVTVVNYRVKFYHILERHYKENTIAYGAFLRVDIPHVCKELSVEDDFILYTDNDVMFMSDVSELENYKPEYYSCAGEFNKISSYHGCNTGVMILNQKNLLKIYDEFVDFIGQNLNNFQVYDQDAIKLFFKEKIQQLDYRYNYKPYWGPFDDIKILHFHGPKPTQNEEELSKFPLKQLITPYFMESSKLFNEYYKNC